MKNRWGKGDPVNLSDLLKITPVANEIIHISEELGMSLTDVMWIVSQIIENGDEFLTEGRAEPEIVDLIGVDWDEIERENLAEHIDQPVYMVSVKINGAERFPEIGFKAGVSDSEDMHYFFDMILEMLDKLD